MIYRSIIRPVAFRCFPDAEDAHDWGMAAMGALAWTCRQIPALAQIAKTLTGATNPQLSRTIAGIRFPTPIGLAGGFDKQARAIHGWAALGFGFAEVGTVTCHPQPGNPRPRLFRLPQQQAIINRFGFNNPGCHALALNLRRQLPFPIPVMVSLGKSKITPNEQATEDYLESLRQVHPYADLISINVSSPNTPGLRQLQDRIALQELLSALQSEGRRLGPNPSALWRETRHLQNPTPLFLKISPDLTTYALDELLEVVTEQKVAGLIATNTTLDRDKIPATTPRRDETGGLSGPPLHEKSLQVLRHIRRQLPKIPLIGVGGIHNPQTAMAMFEAGADLVQIYTGLVYEGPGLPRLLNLHLRDKLPQSKPQP
jgi:dihydroorotate dehydrogenase